MREPNFSGHRPYDLDSDPAFWLHVVSSRLRTATTRYFHAHGRNISVEQWAVLVRLGAEDGCTQQQLAHVVHRDKAAVSRVIDALAERGLLERAHDPDDARSHRIFLTDAGTAMVRDLTPLARDLSARLFAGVPPTDVVALLESLRIVSRNLERGGLDRG